MNAPVVPSLADPEPISGRSEPREHPGPSHHDVRVDAATDPVTGRAYLRAYCKPCDWAVSLDNGHRPNDFVRLELQHFGVTA